MAGFRPLGGRTRGRAGGGPLADRAPGLKRGVCTLSESTHTIKIHAYTLMSLYKDRRAVCYTFTYAGVCTALSMQTRSHKDPQNTHTRAQVPGPIPFTHKLEDVFTCALTYMLRCFRTEKFKDTHLYTHVQAMNTQHASTWAETHLYTYDADAYMYYTRLWDWGVGRRQPE